MLRLLDVEQIHCFDWSLTPHNVIDHDEARLIRHPFPVLDLEDGSFLLLQDADSFRSYQMLDLTHLPVQVCTRKSLRVTSPRLALINFTYGDLQAFAEENRGLICLDEPDSSTSHNDYLHLHFEFPRHRSLIVHMRSDHASGCPAGISALFQQILRKGTYMPDGGSGSFADAVLRSQTFSGHLTLPSFGLIDLERAAFTEQYFPPYVIMVQTDRRVFNIDFPLSVLRAEIPVEEKEQFLKDMVLIREQSCRTTFFEGQVYILNR